MSFDLWITSNSPGEVSSWVAGVMPWIRQHRPDWRVHLLLVPCPYASGAEKRVAQAIPGFCEVMSPRETVMWYLGLTPSTTPKGDKGAVLFLGGDPWHALLLKRKLGLPVLGYFEKPSPWTRWFDGVALAYQGDIRRGSDHFVGNLMVDRLNWNPTRPEGRPVRIGLFPGSRAWQARLTLGPMLTSVQELSQTLGQAVQFELVKSPFITDQGLARALSHPFPLGLPVTQAQIADDHLILESGLKIAKRTGGVGLEGLDLAVTIPGTNTAELACAGIPFVVILHPLAYIGGGGLSGLLERLPLPNRLKSYLRKRKHRRLKLTALPNQKAGRMLVPELVLTDSLEPLTSLLRRWVEEPQEVERRRNELQGVMGEPGATRRLAEWIFDAVERPNR